MSKHDFFLVRTSTGISRPAPRYSNCRELVGDDSCAKLPFAHLVLNRSSLNHHSPKETMISGAISGPTKATSCAMAPLML